MPFTGSDLFKILLAIILPPLGVFLERGCNADFFINILLTILGYIPVCLRLPILTDFLHNHLSHTQCTNNQTGYHPRALHHLQVLSLPIHDCPYTIDYQATLRQRH